MSRELIFAMRLAATADGGAHLVSAADTAAASALTALYLLLTVGYVWVRLHCPVAHRRGDMRAYLRHCWRVWCVHGRGVRDHFRSDSACLYRVLRRVGLAAPSSRGEGGRQASAPDTTPTLTP